MNAPSTENPTPCHGRTHLFLSPTDEAHRQARKFCLGDPATNTPICPFLDWCKDEAKATLQLRPQSLEGTWAGELYTDKKMRPRPACGTPGGYTSHKWYGEETCADCRRAEADAVSERRRKKATKEVAA